MDQTPAGQGPVTAEVAFRPDSRYGCLIAGFVGLIPAAGVIVGAHFLGWLSGHVWSVGGLSFLVFLITWIGVAYVISRSRPVTEGTVSIDGSRFSGPDEGQHIDFDKPYVVEMAANDKRAALSLIGDKVRLNAYYRNQMLRLIIEGLTHEMLTRSFPARFYVASRNVDKPADKTLWLDRANAGQRKFVDTLIAVLEQSQEQNFRYRQFVKLPWELKPAPDYLPIVDLEIKPDKDPHAYFGVLAKSEVSSPMGVVAHAYAKVVLWLDDFVGITPDYVLLHTHPEGKKGHLFSLLPLGRAHLKVRRETFSSHKGEGTTMGTPASTRYPKLVFEVSGHSQELEVILFDRYDEEVTDDIEAAVEFINRPLKPDRIPSAVMPATSRRRENDK